MVQRNRLVQGLRNYLLAEDITRGLNALEFRAREYIVNEELKPVLERILEINYFHKRMSKLSASLMPNLITGLSLTTGLYLKSPLIAITGSILGEIARNSIKLLYRNVNQNIADLIDYTSLANCPMIKERIKVLGD